MLDILEIHVFYEANVPGYERRDVHKINRFFLDEWKPFGAWGKKPMVFMTARWEEFKKFVWCDWYGWPQELTRSMVVVHESPVKDRPHISQGIERGWGFCDCGGRWIKRQNSVKKNFFLGCSNYPRCKNTMPI